MTISIERLDELRALAQKDLGDVLDPRLVASQLRQLERTNVPPTAPSYFGVSTFLKAPLARSLQGIDIAMVGVPFDLGVTNRAGARFGPQQVRQMSSTAGGPMHHALGIIPDALCEIVDYGDVPIADQYGLDAAIEEIEAFYAHLIAQGAAPLTVGGDHSISYPILKALGRSEPLGVVHIDAHCDTGPEIGGTRFHHGAPFRNAALTGAIDTTRTIQIGIRGHAEPIWGFSRESGMTVLHIEEVYDLGIAAVVAKAREVVGRGPLYVSVDVDCMDPAFTPGTGTPEIGGLVPREVQQIIRGLRGLDVRGADVVEVSPPYDPSGNTALVAATILWELLCITSESVHRRKQGQSS